MLAGKTVLAVVPARGGSKGIPLKNLREVGGVPIVARVGQLLKTMPWIDRAIVSTDHDEIARVAEGSGLAAPFRRPESLSGDRIGDAPVLIHALKFCEQLDKKTYDVTIMLQPTSPLRTSEQVQDTVVRLIDGQFDCVWTLSPSDPKMHPLRQLSITDDMVRLYDPAGAQALARQELTPLYYRNGICYAFARNCLLEQGTIYGEKMGAVVINEPVVNIDTEIDLVAADRAVINRNRARNAVKQERG